MACIAVGWPHQWTPQAHRLSHFWMKITQLSILFRWLSLSLDACKPLFSRCSMPTHTHASITQTNSIYILKKKIGLTNDKRYCDVFWLIFHLFDVESSMISTSAMRGRGNMVSSLLLGCNRHGGHLGAVRGLRLHVKKFTTSWNLYF